MSEDRVLELARKRFETAESAEREIREEMKLDLRFRAGDQWPSMARAMREKEGRPCLVVNRIPQFVRQVCNDQRQNRPSIQVSPVDDYADPETAKVLQGLIRHIEYDSGASAAYDSAFEHAATTGRGYFRVVTEYVDHASFDLDIKIKRIVDPLSVYLDPEAKEPDRSDAKWCFIVDTLSKEAFEALYPEAKLSSGATSWEEARQSAPLWLDADGVRVAEYFSVETRKITIHLLEDGQVMADAEYQTLGEAAPGIAKTRKVDAPAVVWRKLTGTEILEETTWPGQWIPILTVLGDEYEVDGQTILEGVVRHARDTQRMLNYWVSAETEAIALAPRAPWLVAEGQLEGYEKAWKTANTQNHAYLTYRQVDLNGHPAPAPHRTFAEPAVGAITAARMQCADDLKALTGIYDAALGARSNEQSGRAIMARQRQSSTANFHLMDNLTRALRHLGRILVDLIPKIYDTERVVRIIGDDEKPKTIRLNAPFREDGISKIFDLGVGRYDVTVDAGPSYETKRQEAVAAILDLVQSFPPIMQVAGDILIRNMDWSGSKEIAERLKKTMDPAIVDDGKQKGPDAAAQLEQMGQMVEQLTQALNEAQDRVTAAEQAVAEAQQQLSSKEADLQVRFHEIQNRSDIDAAKIALDAQKLEIEAQKLALEAQRVEIERHRTRIDGMRERLPMGELPELGIDAETGEPFPAPEPPVTRDDLAILMQALVGAAAAQQPPPPQPMPPQVVVLRRTETGDLVGEVREAAE